MPGMTCQVNDVNDDNDDDDDDDDQNAWDDDEVTNTIWHPGTSGEGAHTTMHSKHKLIIHRIRVRQHRVSFCQGDFWCSDSENIQWESGYATKMVISINGNVNKLSPVNNDYNLVGIFIV